MYKQLLQTKYDKIFKSANLDDIKRLNFKQLPSGKYSTNIYHDTNILIKIFNKNKYKYNQNINYFDYILLEKLNNFNLQIPKLFGYKSELFMIVEYIKGINLSNIKNININLLKILINYLLELEYNVYKLTKYVICDLTPKNIIINSNPIFIDFSNISIFNSSSYSRKYVIFEINNLLTILLKNKQINLNLYNFANNYINNLYEQNYFKKWEIVI